MEAAAKSGTRTLKAERQNAVRGLIRKMCGVGASAATSSFESQIEGWPAGIHFNWSNGHIPKADELEYLAVGIMSKTIKLTSKNTSSSTKGVIPVDETDPQLAKFRSQVSAARAEHQGLGAAVARKHILRQRIRKMLGVGEKERTDGFEASVRGWPASIPFVWTGGYLPKQFEMEYLAVGIAKGTIWYQEAKASTGTSKAITK